MINIISPKSVYVDITDPSTYTLEWQGTLENSQVSYEVLYREKGNETWLTTGKNKTTDQTYDLRNIYTLINVDFVEIEYKVVITCEKTGDNEIITGTESSNVYSLIFNQGITCDLNVWTGSEKRVYPLFDEIKNDTLNKMTIHTEDGDKMLPLVNEGSILSDEMKVRVDENTTQCVAGSNPDFKYYTPSETDVFGEFDVDGQYTYNYQQEYSYVSEPSYNYSYIDSSVQNYLSGYTSFITNYSYNYSYSRSDLSTSYKYYNYLKSYTRTYHTDNYYYVPLQKVQSVYLKYSYGYMYSYYGGGGSYSANVYAYYYTYATGTYLSYVQTSSQGSSSFGRSTGGATYAPADLVYYAFTTGRYYYYKSTPVYAYDKTYHYYYWQRSTAYAYTNDIYAYKQYYYYSYTNTYAYKYTDDVYAYNYQTLEGTQSYSYTYYC